MTSQYSNNNSEETLDIRGLLLRCLRNWYWFAITVVVCLIVAFLYIKTKTPKYEVSSTIMIRSDESTPSLPSSEMLEMFGLGGSKMVEDELEIIGSRNIMRQTISLLDLQTEYRKHKGLRWVGQYPTPDLIVEYPVNFCDTMKRVVKMSIKRNSKTYTVKVKYGKFLKSSTAVVNFNEPVRTCIGPVMIKEVRPLESGDQMRIKTTPMPNLVDYYRAAVTAKQINKESYVVSVSTITDMPKRAQAMISKMIELYNMDALIDKNMMASNTGAFIEERLQIITDELDTVEHEVERYRKINNLSDISTEVNIALQTKSSYQKQIAELETQINLITYIQDYVLDPKNEFSLIPANLGVEDQSLTSLIAEYNKMLLERMKLLRNATSDNPIVAQTEDQIASVRGNIISSINSLKDGLNIAKNDVTNKDEQYNRLIRSVPTKERQYVEIKRQQQIKEQLFLYLYEKREENALALASAVTPAKIIDAAERSASPVSPKSKMIYLVALMLGVCIPVGFMFVYDYFNNTFATHREYEKAVKVPFLGQMAKSSESRLVKEQHSSTAELFRLLRTNMRFMLPAENKNNIVLVTSSINGEGKTFVVSNLAAYTAMLDKKVVVIGLDIRNPQLAKAFSLSQAGCLTSYLADASYTIDDIILPSGVNDNLDVIPAGAIPPNPAELLQSQRLKQLFEELSKRYDYIFIDSAPVAMVSDTFLLADFADLTVYVSRAKYTTRDMADFINDIYDQKRLKNMACVLNAVESVHAGYGYGYGYGYPNHKQEKKGFFHKKNA